MRKQPDRRIGRDRQCASADCDVRTAHPNEIHHQGHGKDRTAAADKTKHESDEGAGESAEQILERLQHQTGVAFSSSLGLRALRS